MVMKVEFNQAQPKTQKRFRFKKSLGRRNQGWKRRRERNE